MKVSHKVTAICCIVTVLLLIGFCRITRAADDYVPRTWQFDMGTEIEQAMKEFWTQLDKDSTDMGITIAQDILSKRIDSILFAYEGGRNRICLSEPAMGKLIERRAEQLKAEWILDQAELDEEGERLLDQHGVYHDMTDYHQD